MRRQTIAYGVLVVAILTVASLLIGTLDIYLAVACAFAADMYVVYISRHKNKQFAGSRFAPLMLVAVAPAFACVALFFYGLMGSWLDLVFRAMLTTGFSIAFFITTYPIIPAAQFKIFEEHLSEKHATPLVSILVPAYNEQGVISRTLSSLINLKYENKEIIVIDDGSSDLTRFVASGYEKHGVKVVSKPNGGKASALNYGLTVR